MEMNVDTQWILFDQTSYTINSRINNPFVGTIAGVIVDLIRVVNTLFGFDIVLQHGHTTQQGSFFLR